MINFFKPDESTSSTITDEDIISFINNQEFINSLVSITKNNLHDHPALEVHNIMKTFQNVLNNNGPDSFNIMYVLFDNDHTPSLVLEPRPYTSKDEMYVVLAEMMFSYSSFKAKSFLVAMDTTMTQLDTQDTSNVKKIESLIISFVNNDSAAAVTLPYEFDASTNTVIWSHQDFTCLPIDSNDNEGDISLNGPMTELLFVMSHVMENPFSINSLVNYYNFRDFPTMVPSESIAHRVTLEI